MEYADLKNEICGTWLQLNSEQMAQIRITLLDLSSAVSGEIPRMREITRCSNFAAALRLLEKWKILTPVKVDVIFQLANQIGTHTEMVRERITQYKKLSMPSLPPSPLFSVESRKEGSCFAKTFLNSNSRLDQVYEYLSENHNGRWADIGRSLGVSNLVSILQQDPGLRLKDKIYQMFEEYAKTVNGDPMTGILLALETCGLKRQRNHILRDILPS